jgi:hypothetical protein
MVIPADPPVLLTQRWSPCTIIAMSLHMTDSGYISCDSVKKNLQAAVADLYKKERDIHRFTSHTIETEWNLTAHLAPEIIKYFKGYSYDVDVAKVPAGYKRPDIIIHKRGHGAMSNLLVIEIKRNGGPADAGSDEKKIRGYWFDKPYCYRFGASVNLNTGNRKHGINVFDNSRWPCQ